MLNFPVPNRSSLGFQNFPFPSKLRQGFPDFRSSTIQKIRETLIWAGAWTYGMFLALDILQYLEDSDMASTYKNAKSISLTTSLADIYTCPSSTIAIIMGIQVSNIDGTNAADADVAWTDSSDTDAVTYLIKGADVAAGEALSAMAPEFKLVLEAGDKIQAKASAASDLAISVAVLEIS